MDYDKPNTVNGNDTVIGYAGKEYTLDGLKEICPSRDDINKRIQDELENKTMEKEFSKIYNSKEVMTDEVWVRVADRYFVSSKGRIKFLFSDGKVDYVTQGIKDKIGYLKMDIDNNIKERFDHTNCVYYYVACAFLGKTQYDGLHIHHIDNNGYRNYPENLILLTKEQHDYIHNKKG